MTIKKILLLSILVFPLFIKAQIFQPLNYPKGYFGWPVIATKGIVANFGELRPNHYHMGLDCRTDQHENVTVVAAADGYVAKVKIEPYGFGRAIYINHPNGLTTLYAHLNDFNPALEKYITDQQYALKSWRVFLDLPANLFPVKKGQLIAYSGNTGGSQGPHVHFEIRDTRTDKVLNPMLFGMPIADNTPPDVLRLAVYDRTISTYEQSPKFYPVKKVNGVYTTVPATIVVNSDKVSFAITAYDRYTGSTNKNGIFEADLYDNDQPVVGFRLDSISYSETRYLNAHIDYKLRSSGGSWVQHLSRLPGYPQGVYKDVSGDGVISLDADDAHPIRIDVWDANENLSKLQFSVKKSAWAKNSSANSATFQQDKMFHPGFINVFDNGEVSFYLPEDILYDSIRFKYNKIATAGFPIYQIQNATVPAQDTFPIRIKQLNVRYPNKIAMHWSGGGKSDFMKAEPEAGGWYKAGFKAFGNYQLVQDTIPPSIVPVGFREGMKVSANGRIAFAISDATEELENFYALLDGEWLRFSNDKGRTFIYKMDEHCAPGAHELIISVEDCVGNRTQKTYHFTR